MGLFGALIVRPTALGARLRLRPVATPSSTADHGVHGAAVRDRPVPAPGGRAGQRRFNFDNYHPRYWLINGRGFPDSIADNGAAWLPTQPYGALAASSSQVLTRHAPGHPLPGLARFLNVGTEDYPFHPHGNNGRVIGRDGSPLEGAGRRGPLVREVRRQRRARPDLGRAVQLVRRRALRRDDQPMPGRRAATSNQEVGMFYSGSPYLGDDERAAARASRPSTSAVSTTSSPTTTPSTRSPRGA